MALATVLSRAQNGLAADLVTIEADLSPGLPGFYMVGLPEAAVRESRERVKAAVQNCGYEFPNRRITVNLGPADLPKEGGRFDLAIALAVLTASEQVPGAPLAKLEVLGELSLAGDLRPVRGVLPAALRALKADHALLVPAANADEALLAGSVQIHVASRLASLCASLHAGAVPLAEARPVESCAEPAADLSEVRGQHQAKRAMEIAAAGGHSILMVGPPGAGKSMLASRLPALLPPLTDEEALEVAAVASIGPEGFDPRKHWRQRPFRTPHHTASGVALVGGSGSPKPGEITLAHLGVLFLDELPEFDRRVLEVLREPLETGRITISRAAKQSDFPARFQLIAAMNPCECGYLGDSSGKCRCTPDRVARYRSRISGPLLDRIDLQIFVPRVERQVLTATAPPPGESGAAVRQRVTAARQRQLARRGKPNARLSARETERDCALDMAGRKLLDAALTRLSLSARAYHRVLRVARTIADLAQAEMVAATHVAEAVRYRELDRSAP